MAKVVVSPEARNDIISAAAYIRDELCNPDAAKRIVGELRKTITGLREMPARGISLDSIIAVHTEFRFLPCENYRIFYVLNDDTVEVIRIIHMRQNYMKVLFE